MSHYHSRSTARVTEIASAAFSLLIWKRDYDIIYLSIVIQMRMVDMELLWDEELRDAGRLES